MEHGTYDNVKPNYKRLPATFKVPPAGTKQEHNLTGCRWIMGIVSFI